MPLRQGRYHTLPFDWTIPPLPLTLLLFTPQFWRNGRPLQPRKIFWSCPRKFKFTSYGLSSYCYTLSDIPGAPLFDGQKITDFLDRCSQLCEDYHLSESKKNLPPPVVFEFFTGNYVKIRIKGADWSVARLILRREYKDNGLDQLMNTRESLEALKSKNPVSKTMIFCNTANYLLQSLGT